MIPSPRFDNCATGRFQFFSKREVLRAAAENAEACRDDRYYYPCGQCGWWHLTRQPPVLAGRWWGGYRFARETS